MRAKKAKMLRAAAKVVCSELGIILERQLIIKDNGYRVTKYKRETRNPSAINNQNSIRYLYRQYKKEYLAALRAGERYSNA